MAGSSASSAANPSAALRVGTTETGRSRHLRDLASGEDDVRVVGQEQDLARRDGPDRLEQLAGARVGRLPALDDGRDAEVAEDRGQAVARGDGDDGQGRGIGAVGRRGAGAPGCRSATAAGRCDASQSASGRRRR